MRVSITYSGIAGPDHEKIIELQRKVFGEHDFFFQQWEGYPHPNIPDCLYTPEPKWDYHCMADVKVKPDCDIFRRYTEKPNGKMYRKARLFKQD